MMKHIVSVQTNYIEIKGKIVHCKATEKLNVAKYFKYACILMYVQRYTIKMLEITLVAIIYRMKPDFFFNEK